MHNNSFDHLRLIAAYMVLITHQFGVLKLDAEWPLGILGAWGVNIFFAISGYLNTISLLSSKSPPVFLMARGLRIYPALIFCIAFTVLLGACVTTKSPGDYFGLETFQHFWRNAGVFFGQRNTLPGVFESNPVVGMNASLWTLPIEGRFYLYLAAAIFVLRYLPLPMAALWCVACLYALWTGVDSTIDKPTERLGILFVTGACIAAVQRLRSLSAAAILVTAMAALFFARGQTFIGAMLLVALGSVLAGQIQMPPAFRLKLDISYGVYLFAFPIQQLTVWWGLSFWPGIVTATVLTVAIALFSAIAVEQPALQLAKRLKARMTRDRPETRLSAAQ